MTVKIKIYFFILNHCPNFRVHYSFIPYTEFPDTEKLYTDNVIEIFGQRIIKSDRNDIREFYSFWEVDERYKEDKYYMLAHTQGMLPTDNFEFLADYRPKKELRFLTDLACLSILKLARNMLRPDDELRFELDKNNTHDKYAIKVFKDQMFVGYIKKIHCKVFHKRMGKYLKLKVKAIDQNETINKIFVIVSFS